MRTRKAVSNPSPVPKLKMLQLEVYKCWHCKLTTPNSRKSKRRRSRISSKQASVLNSKKRSYPHCLERRGLQVLPYLSRISSY